MALPSNEKSTGITAEWWDKASNIFDGARTLTPEQRKVYLEGACGGDELLRVEVEELLAGDEAAPDDFLPPLVERGSLAPGRMLGKYRIVRFLAEGGMGEVYEAVHTLNGKAVALKVLKPALADHRVAQKRFHEELLAAQKIAHPNVCRLYDVDLQTVHYEEHDRQVLFLTMELLSGQTLERRLAELPGGRMTQQQALPLLRQMAEGLAAAHGVGVLHQDFKPSNVMLTETAGGETLVVITDFGLARPATPGMQTVAPSERFVTMDYSAPEQLEDHSRVGKPTDVYSFGLVAYQMLTGKLPFEGESDLGRAFKRLKDAPAPPRAIVPDLSPQWEAAVLGCLERNPEKRFQSPNDFIEALSARPRLRWKPWAAAAALLAALASAPYLTQKMRAPSVAGNREVSVAVMFTNRTGDPARDYFSDGLAGSLIQNLTRARNLRVVPVLAPPVSNAPLTDDELIRRLGVEYLLQGMVLESGDKIRLAVRMAGAAGRVLWSQSYDRSSKDILTLQDQLSSELASKLQVQLAGFGPAGRGAGESADTQAVDLYWQGRYHWNKRTTEGVSNAMERFQRATAIDPNFALAYSGLADAYSVAADYAHMPPGVAIPRARNAAARALALGAGRAEVQASVGFVNSLDIWDSSNAEPAFQRAIELNPKYASTYQWYAVYLMKHGQRDAALKLYQSAERMDPQSAPVVAALAWFHIYDRNPAAALAQTKRVLEVDPDYSAAQLLSLNAEAQQGRLKQALAEIEARHAAGGTLPYLPIHTGYLYALAGKRAEALRIVEDRRRMRGNQQFLAGQIGALYSALNMQSEAMEWLERAYDEHDPFLLYLRIYPHFDNMRPLPRFDALLRKVGLQ